MSGRQPGGACDVLLDHGSCSRLHAVVQHRDQDRVYLIDMGSTHGTRVNKKPIVAREHLELRVGDVVRFGESTRLFVLCGPEHLRRPDHSAKLEAARKAHLAAVLRRHAEAAADGSVQSQAERDSELEAIHDVSWGMGPEDAEPVDAITELDQDFKDFRAWLETAKAGSVPGVGPSSIEKVEKLVLKCEKEERKLDNMSKELKNILAKQQSHSSDSSEVGDRQQQVAGLIAVCEEEINTLQDEIRDAIDEACGIHSSRGGGFGGGVQKRPDSDEEDDFFDRSKDKAKSKNIVVAPAESSQSLSEKLANIKILVSRLEHTINTLTSKIEADVSSEDNDELDNFMTNISQKAQIEKRTSLERELFGLRADETRYVAMLKLIKVSTVQEVVPSSSSFSRTAVLVLAKPNLKGDTDETESEMKSMESFDDTLSPINTTSLCSSKVSPAEFFAVPQPKSKSKPVRPNNIIASSVSGVVQTQPSSIAANTTVIMELAKVPKIGPMAPSIRSTLHTSGGGVHYQLDEAVELKGRNAVEQDDVPIPIMVNNEEEEISLDDSYDTKKSFSNLNSLLPDSGRGGLIIRKKPLIDIVQDLKNKRQKLANDLLKSTKIATLDVPPQAKVDHGAGVVGTGEERQSNWSPPADQKGDGRTKLNAKFGY